MVVAVKQYEGDVAPEAETTVPRARASTKARLERVRRSTIHIVLTQVCFAKRLPH